MTRAEITKRSYDSDELLRQILAGGPTLSGDVKAAFASRGLSASNARCARDRLGAKCRWTGGMGVSQCYWYMPSNPVPTRTPPSPSLLVPHVRVKKERPPRVPKVRKVYKRKSRAQVPNRAAYVPEEIARMQAELNKKLSEVDSFLQKLEPLRPGPQLMLDRPNQHNRILTCGIDGDLDGGVGHVWMEG